MTDSSRRAGRARDGRMRPCAFLDRDGTLNVDTGYTHRPEDLTLVEGAREAVRRLNDRGWLVVVVTNQSGIARGYFDEAAMHRFHDAVQAELAQAGARIDAFYFCPHHVDGVVPGYCADHPDRKPAPGMLLRAMAEILILPKHYAEKPQAFAPTASPAVRCFRWWIGRWRRPGARKPR